MKTQRSLSKRQDGGDASSQQDQIIQYIVEALSQGADPNDLVAQLVEAGISEDQANQLIEVVMNELNSGGGDEQEAMDNQEEEGYEMRSGGSYSGTYSNGVYYQDGGNIPEVPYPFMMMHGGATSHEPYLTPKVNMNSRVKGNYQVGGEYELNKKEVEDLINAGYKIKYL